MKNLLVLFALVLSMSSFGQDLQNNLSFYAATGISMPNSADFSQDSYVSAEVGAMYDNVAFAVVVGRNNLDGFGQNDSFNNYWYEGKVAVYQPIGYVDGYILGGVGSYVDGSSIFVEYGAGVSKEFETFGVFIQVSNWDGVNYITPGVTFGL